MECTQIILAVSEDLSSFKDTPWSVSILPRSPPVQKDSEVIPLQEQSIRRAERNS